MPLNPILRAFSVRTSSVPAAILRGFRAGRAVGPASASCDRRRPQYRRLLVRISGYGFPTQLFLAASALAMGLPAAASDSLPAPTALFPLSNQLIKEDTVRLSWHAVPDADGYAVSARTPGIPEGRILVQDSATADTFLVIGGLPRGEIVQWQVRARAGGEWGNPSDTARAFRVSAVESAREGAIIPIAKGNRWGYATRYRNRHWWTRPARDTSSAEDAYVDIEILEASPRKDTVVEFEVKLRKTVSAGSGAESVSEEGYRLRQVFPSGVPRLEYFRASSQDWSQASDPSAMAVFDPGKSPLSSLTWCTYGGAIRARFAGSRKLPLQPNWGPDETWEWNIIEGIGATRIGYEYYSSGAAGGGETQYEMSLADFNGKPFVGSDVGAADPPTALARKPRTPPARTGEGIQGWLAPLASAAPGWTETGIFGITGRRIASIRTAAQASAFHPPRGIYLIRARCPGGIRTLLAFAP